MTKIHRIFILLLLLIPLLGSAAETVRILGIGNSFTNNAHHYLSDIYQSVDGVDAEIGTAIIGGCSLERHVRHAQEQESDANAGKEYGYRLNGKMVQKDLSLKDILLAEDWDIISIQQVSTLSCKADSFQPYADELIAYIRKYRPNAEIVVHETWSHSVNSIRAKQLKIDPDWMYVQLHANYTKLAQDNGFRLIPAGTAFQNARTTEMWHLIPNDFDPDHNRLRYPEDKDNLPDMSKSLNSDYYWLKTGKGWILVNDGYHANAAGQYLAALVWFDLLSGCDAREVTFKPNQLTEPQAVSLRQIAHDTVAAMLVQTSTPQIAAPARQAVP
jgi:hypothetical protein